MDSTPDITIGACVETINFYPHTFPPPLRPLREPHQSPTPNSLCQDKVFPRKIHINFALGNEIQTIAVSPGVRTDFPRGGQRQTKYRPTPRRIRRKTYSLYALPPRDPEREQPHAATTPPARSPLDRRTATSDPAWNGDFQPPRHSPKQTMFSPSIQRTARQPRHLLIIEIEYRPLGRRHKLIRRLVLSPPQVVGFLSKRPAPEQTTMCFPQAFFVLKEP